MDPSTCHMRSSSLVILTQPPMSLARWAAHAVLSESLAGRQIYPRRGPGEVCGRAHRLPGVWFPESYISGSRSPNIPQTETGVLSNQPTSPEGEEGKQ